MTDDQKRMANAYHALDDKPRWAAWVAWWPDIADGMAADADCRDEPDMYEGLRRGD